MQKAIIAFSLFIAVIFLIMFYITARLDSRQFETEAVTSISIDKEMAANRLSRAIQHITISRHDISKTNHQAFSDIHLFMSNAYPHLHRTLKREIVNGYSLLYTWKGANPDLKPIILMAHVDVVPISKETEDRWTYPPFSGEIDEQYIWGRGSLDDKASLIAILEAVEYLLENGFLPLRTIYLVFGHDEEILGKQGAAQIADLLKARNINAEMILDEGGSIMMDLPNIPRPVSMVGIAEKGYMTLELNVEQSGGHSSIPPRQGAIEILSRSICRLSKNQFPSRLDGPTWKFFEYLAPELSFHYKFAIANKWFFKPFIIYQLAKNQGSNASIRTTYVSTVIDGGRIENMLPQKARAIINFRLYPGDDINTVLEYVSKTIQDDRVSIKPSSTTPAIASNISSTKSIGFKKLQKTIHQVIPDSIVAPCLTLASTDTKHFSAISPNIFRFAPIRYKNSDIKRTHGTDERISIGNLEEMVIFYIQLLENFNES